MIIDFNAESPSDDSSPLRISNAVFGSPSTPSDWLLDHHTAHPLYEPTSPHLNTELTLPSPRNPTSYPPIVHHHGHLNDPSSSHSPNPLTHNGFIFTPPLIEHDLLNSHLRTIPVLDFPLDHGLHHQSNSQLSPTNLQHPLHPQLDPLATFQSPSPTAPPLNFSHIRSDYLTMITTKTPDNPTSNKAEGVRSPVPSSSLSPLTPLADDDIAAQAVMDVLEASPEYKIENEFSAYLTSPLDDSPWEDDMLTTPSFGSVGDSAVDILTSPALIDSSDNFADLPLFSDAPLFDLTFDKLNAHNAALFHTESDGMYTINSPHSSSQSHLGRDTSITPGVPGRAASTARSVSTSTKGNRRKSAPTGTRKNVTPESLVPIEAPIQPRKYVTSSVTSRKELPAVFARKRKRSAAFEAEHDDEDQLAADPSAVPPTPVELDAIEAKRRQNTLAARRSRKRKLEHQQELENAIDSERREKEAWKVRALALEALLRSHGIKIPLELEEGRH